MSAPLFRGGKNIALKVPAHQFAATVQACRALGIPVASESADAGAFAWGPRAAADALASTPFARCDAIEPLRPGFPGFWVTSPASIIHLVTENE